MPMVGHIAELGVVIGHLLVFGFSRLSAWQS